MSINRHNYEEFFLMFVDGELSASEKAAVETFVQQNSDLAEELKMLKDSVLPAEEINYDQKELLYKNSSLVTNENYEEYFLLSIDEELSQSEQSQVKKFVLKHPDLQKEYKLLQRTKLEPEVVDFKGKSALYKTTKRTSVVFIGWMRLAAAAACIALVVCGWFFNQQKALAPSENITVNGQKQVKKVVLKAHRFNNIPIADKAVVTTSKKEIFSGNGFKKQGSVETKFQPVVNPSLARNTKPKAAGINDENRENLNYSTKKVVTNDLAVVSIDPGNKNNLPSTSENLMLGIKSTFHSEDHQTSIVKPAVYTEIDNQIDDDDERNFYIGSAEINKNKLKSLFKKAASLFERKNNNDGERTIKIAGFEIKSK